MKKLLFMKSSKSERNCQLWYWAIIVYKESLHFNLLFAYFLMVVHCYFVGENAIFVNMINLSSMCSRSLEWIDILI